ncbi:type II secretion system F family protein [Paraburkholderia sp. A3RO-2L]|uniref:type II secretion system F family protein n=1 Tax=unclassified Paraburkholderia TaxID=2615204 RepID=UPI003DA966F3
MKSYKVKIAVNRKVVETVIAAPNIEEARKLAAYRGQVLAVTSNGGGSRGLSVADRLMFFQRLASMLGSKVSASEALEIIFQSFTGAIRDAARILRDEIVRGATLYEAMERAGSKYFPEAIVAIVKTGSRGGDQAYAIREAARFERELEQVKKESSKGLWSALMGFVAGVITILASTYYVAPMILNSSLVSASGGTDIGWVMTLSKVISAIAIIASVIMGGVFFYGVVIRPFAPAAVDRGILKIPFYRDMALAKTNYMVFFGLGVLLKAGLRVEEALELSIESAPKGELRNDLERARTAIMKGSVKPWPFYMTMLHPTDKAALATAQDREQTARTIEQLAITYQTLYRSRLELFVPSVQAFSAVFLALAGFVLFGVSVIPLMQSTSSIMKML